jgi:Zn-dependent M28 family amino/carboxypeptidase
VVLGDVARRPAVPGANDNATGVATLVALARRLRERPVRGLRVLLVSTGSEESFTEGMCAFLDRHGDELDPATTRFLVVDCTGGPTLVQLEGEGMLYITPYDEELKTLVTRAGREEGIGCLRGLQTRSITDALPAARRGYRAAMLTSVDPVDSIPNYHWPTDLPENVDYDTVAAGVRVCDRVIRRLAAD